MQRKKGVYERYIKRAMDFTLALIVLLILSPFVLLIFILIRIKLGGPVIFKQERPGRNEKIFTMYKFRTMTDAKDENGEFLPDTVRLTKFGRFLRSTSIDELPELWNIIRGDMSIVGPRPLLVRYLDVYNEKERLRHTVRGGLTGLAQISGRNAISWEDKFAHDVLYIEHITFRKDMAIIFRTAFKLFRRVNDVGLCGLDGFEAFDTHRRKQNKETVKTVSSAQ